MFLAIRLASVALDARVLLGTQYDGREVKRPIIAEAHAKSATIRHGDLKAGHCPAFLFVRRNPIPDPRHGEAAERPP